MSKVTVRLVFACLIPVLMFTKSRADTSTADPTLGQPADRQTALQLSLKQAVDLALAPEGNAQVQLANELVRQTRDRLAQSRAPLLPNFESSVLQQNLTRNLAAFGIRIATPIPGFRFPEIVGPFDVFDARLTVSQSIFDFSSIRRFQAARIGVRVAETEVENVQDGVAAQVARLYVSALRAEARVGAVQANVALAETLLKLASDQKNAGTGTAIEVTRAQVQLLNERQRLLIVESERRQSHLQLAKGIGLDLDVQIQLTDKLTYDRVETLASEATTIALQSRADLKAQGQREENARLAYSAIKMERVPSIVGFADYGTIGSSLDHASPTRTYGVSLRVPLYDGGRRDARRAESLSQLAQERIKTKDLQRQIKLEILLALDNLRSAEEQVKVAEEGLQLSQQELAQARRRYQAGMTSSVEVADAQTRLERATDNRIAALFSYNLARISLGEAMGVIRRIIR
ncbi:MAG: TolC family protein [Acidobacteria bacterium]|nr:TolC family protein [Acidobacteriota bacterium]